jgi:uncharacterized protein
MARRCTWFGVLFKRLALLGLLACAQGAVTAASAKSWTEPRVSPEVKAAMKQVDAGQPADLISLADSGRTDAQFYAGLMLIYGRGGVQPDARKGCDYEVKASSSRADAMYLVGLCWENGLMGAKDTAKAEAAYLRSAQMGFPKSRCALGQMLLGQPGQAERGVALCKESAKAGDVQAQLVVADAYFYGRGVNEDHQESRKWYSMAADKNDPQALRRLGEMYAAGDGGKKDTKTALLLWETAEREGDPLVCILVADQLFSNLTGGKKPAGGVYAFKGGVPVADLSSIEAWYQEALARDPRPDVKQRAERGIKVVQNLKAAANAVSARQ